MRKLLYLWVFAATLLYAENFSVYTTPLVSVNGTTGYVQDSNDFRVGSTGAVYHSFDHANGTIIARATVVSKDGNRAKLHFSEFITAEQKALPSAKIDPRTGDAVLLNYHYDRILPIVPNRDTFNAVTKNRNLTMVHPDIFRAFLIKEGTNVPEYEHFKKFCDINSVGLIYLYLENEGRIVDCNSFVTQAVFAAPHEETFMSPFYSRLDSLSDHGLFGGRVKDYYNYYRSMLK
jgi:hypothetical protein